MSGQPEGCYPRVNGGMIQSNQYAEKIVSIVGKVVDPGTLQTSDGTNITLQTEMLDGGLLVNPDLCVEIIGQVVDATVVTAFVKRDLSSDMDLNLYNQMLQIQNKDPFAQYFSHSQMVTN